MEKKKKQNIDNESSESSEESSNDESDDDNMDVDNTSSEDQESENDESGNDSEELGESESGSDVDYDEEDALLSGEEGGRGDDEDQLLSEKERLEKTSQKELREITRKSSKKEHQLVEQIVANSSFEKLKLSRPLVRAATDMGFTKPTPIQMDCIPAALKGKDICASATTGSGKTAAFVLPILERLLYRPTNIACTRVLILTPTRELSGQCHSVITSLSKYTNGITAALVTGGAATSIQQADLRKLPDILVGTPGRIVDHMLNTPSFSLEDIEILVLDEADRLLDLGFSEQLDQIVKSCPRSRQTMLFSATMTDNVDKLAVLSLTNPERISVDPLFQVARKLTQEFVRVRSGTERDKEATLLALCTRTFKSKVIIFCTHKRSAHRLKIIFGLNDLKASELHGDLTQEQRYDSLENFRDGKVDFLIASDVASRGLDVIGVETVINFELPLHLSSYVHRVGRTARAGRNGCAVSIVTEDDRRLFKAIVKNSNKSVKQRVVPHQILTMWKEKIDSLSSTIQSILVEEHEEKLMRLAEMEANRTTNLIEHRQEIMSRPKKTWFQNEQEKKSLEAESKRLHLGEPKKDKKSKNDQDSDDDSDNSDDSSDSGDDTKKNKSSKQNSKKRQRDESAPETDTRYKLEVESRRVKRRKMLGETKEDEIAKRAIIRQRRRERLGKAAPGSDSASTPGLRGTSKTSGIKLKNKASNKAKSKAPAPPAAKKEYREKSSLFSKEIHKGKRGSFKSQAKYKRRK